MTAVVTIGRLTLRSVLGRRRTIGLGLLVLLPALVFFLSSQALTDVRATEQYVDIMTGLLYGTIVPVVTLIVAGAVLGDERSGNTLSFLVLRPIARWRIAAAKAGTAWLVAGGLSILGGTAMAVALGLVANEWGAVVPTILGIVVATGMYTAIFVPFGHMVERATLIGMVYVFVWEGAIASAIAGLATYSPWRTGLAAFAGTAPDPLARVVPDEFLGSLNPGLGGGLLKTAVLLALSVAFTAWLLRRRDLT